MAQGLYVQKSVAPKEAPGRAAAACRKPQNHLFWGTRLLRNLLCPMGHPYTRWPGFCSLWPGQQPLRVVSRRTSWSPIRLYPWNIQTRVALTP